MRAQEQLAARGLRREDPSSESPGATRVGPVTRALLGVIRLYQGARAGRPTGCRFTPTCSEYACQALEQRGAVAGLVLAVRRLARCRPGGRWGFDPVPERRLS